jgi:REP element-mobilizing transposase RayT
MRQQHIKQGEYPYFLTTNVVGRSKFFEEEKYAILLAGIIEKTCRLKAFILLGYVIMPDHVHILVYPSQARAAVPARQETVLQRAGRAARPRFSVGDLMHGIKSYFVHQVLESEDEAQFHWQPGYNSRVMNSTARLHTVIEYIQYNPIKAGLDQRFQKAPYLYINTKGLQSL